MVPNCTNGWRKTKGSNITYHRLPSGDLKNVWLQKIRRENPRNAQHSFVCSEHFALDCFVVTLAERLCGQTGKKLLKPDAVPTLFKHNVRTNKPRITSERRQ